MSDPVHVEQIVDEPDHLAELPLHRVARLLEPLGARRAFPHLEHVREGASGPRSSCASVARNSSLRLSASRQLGRKLAQVVLELLALRDVLAHRADAIGWPVPFAIRTPCMPSSARTGLEVAEPHLELGVAFLEHRGKTRSNPRLIFGEEELPYAGAPRGVDAVEPNELEACAIDENRNGIESQIPMKSVLFSTSVMSGCVRLRFRVSRVMSRTIFDAPTTLPPSSLIGDTVSDTESAGRRTVRARSRSDRSRRPAFSLAMIWSSSGGARAE